MPDSKSNISFLKFLNELRFAYIIGSSFFIFAFIYGAFEIFEVTVNMPLDATQMRYLHFSRGVLTVIALLIWIAWTLYEFRGRFRQVVKRHDLQYQLVLNAAIEAVVIADANNRIHFWNPAAEKLFGWTQDEALDSKLERLFGHDVTALDTPPPFSGQELELRCTDKNGQVKVVTCSQTLLENENGELESRALIMRDQTTRIVRQAQMERSERLASLGHMAAGVAHEIGNPLTSISSIIQLMQRKITDETSLTQLNRVRENINRITTIVRDLVDFSRPKSPQAVVMNLNDSVTEALGLLRHDARCRDIHFQVKINPKLPAILAIPDQIFQVLLNIIFNAVDACRASESPTVTIETSFDETQVEAAITDNGTGIPPELIGRIFEPFFTTKDVGKGTGLGLSVSHHIITSLGGTLSVESKPGNTQFKITIPVRP